MNIRVIRNLLNTIFIIGAVARILIYYKGHRDTGLYIILVSMVIKFVESALRMMTRND